jgi:hypothetical protein
MKSIDPLFTRVPRPGYNCLNFAKEAWLHITGADIANRIDSLIEDVCNGKVSLASVRSFTKLHKPKSPCFVIMRRQFSTPHAGIFIDGRILHLTCKGVQFQPLKIAMGYFTQAAYFE